LASIDLVDGRMTYACAGHDRPLLVDGKTREVSLIEGKGIVLGVFDGVIIEEETIDINPGDFVIFYTDGVTEARRADIDFFEVEQLVETVARSQCDSAKEMITIIVDAVESFIGATPQADDLTLVVARRI
jgi:sigma-B regulation protein RsbU (phosphoserine phosphatase)